MSLKNDTAKNKDFVEIEYSCKEIENGKIKNSWRNSWIFLLTFSYKNVL